MRKLVLILLIVAIAVMFIACDKPQEEQPTFEQRVIEDACKEINRNTQGATLVLVHSEYVAWLDCEVNNYILTLADGSRWLVGARENEDGFYCDVEGEI